MLEELAKQDEIIIEELVEAILQEVGSGTHESKLRTILRREFELSNEQVNELLQPQLELYTSAINSTINSLEFNPNTSEVFDYLVNSGWSEDAADNIIDVAALQLEEMLKTSEGIKEFSNSYRNMAIIGVVVVAFCYGVYMLTGAMGEKHVVFFWVGFFGIAFILYGIIGWLKYLFKKPGI